MAERESTATQRMDENDNAEHDRRRFVSDGQSNDSEANRTNTEPLPTLRPSYDEDIETSAFPI